MVSTVGAFLAAFNEMLFKKRVYFLAKILNINICIDVNCTILELSSIKYFTAELILTIERSRSWIYTFIQREKTGIWTVFFKNAFIQQPSRFVDTAIHLKRPNYRLRHHFDHLEPKVAHPPCILLVATSQFFVFYHIWKCGYKLKEMGNLVKEWETRIMLGQREYSFTITMKE